MLTEQFYAIAAPGHEVTLWLLIILSIFSVAFILERFFTLRAYKKNSTQILSKIGTLVSNNQLKDIKELATDDSLEGRALKQGLTYIENHGEAGLEEIFNSYTLVEKPKLEKFLNFLATAGSNAPFIGLLGTVFGIMDAFRQLASNQGDGSMVMIGISKALVATGVGLLVAIPAVIAYNHFQKQVKGILQSLDAVKEACIAYAKSNGRSKKVN